jgi:3-phenylpropionate/trans-cinnamate dioxygenase ferredoxin reductase subunit
MLDDGETFEAEKVLLATGGRARRLPAAEGLEHVYYLRSWADAQRLKCALRPGARVAVIGSGFIGAEVAATASVAGCRVEILEAAPRVFGAIHSPIIHEQLCNAHKAAGVQLRAGVQIDKIANLSGGGVAITLQDGEILAADFTVVGIGMVPNTALADALGVRLAAAGIAVDENYQTSVTGLYAAGDVATRSIGVAPGGRVRRIEHWRNAQEQGVGAAAGMLGRQSAELPTAWCWSDQHGHRLEIAGDPEPRHARVERCLGEHKHVTFHLDGTRLAGVTALNAPRVVRDSLSRLATPWYPEACQLADPDRPLSKVESVLDDSEISQ